MTTVSEIKKWVRPIIESYPTMIHINRHLLFRPVNHILRSVVFWGSSERHDPGLGWQLQPLFIPQHLRSSLGNRISVGYTDASGFAEKFFERTSQAIERYLLPSENIQQFHDMAWNPPTVFLTSYSRLHPQNAVLLTALGRFAEAEAMLAGALTELESRAVAQLESGRAMLAKRPNSRVGKFEVKMGESDRALAADLSRLLEHMRTRDGAAVATLLREWELHNAKYWGVEQHWQPTPFPFEMA